MLDAPSQKKSTMREAYLIFSTHFWGILIVRAPISFGCVAEEILYTVSIRILK